MVSSNYISYCRSVLFLFSLLKLNSISGARCWVIGDSIVRWAGEGNPQLQGTSETVWLGLGGARLLGFQNRLNRRLAGRSAPHVLIIHLGTNDVFQLSQYALCRAVEATLQFSRQRLPQCRVIWSCILPRLFWYGEVRQGVGERVRRVANRRAIRLCESLPGDNRVISHPWASRPNNHNLFRRDGVHLSDAGNNLYRRNLEEGIQHFINENSLQFPPV